MCNEDYKKYVTAECERQWKENQEAEHGKWEDQDEQTREDYFEEMYSLLSDELTKCCCDCRYCAKGGEGLPNGYLQCNNPKAVRYGSGMSVNDSKLCFCGDFKEI